MASSKELMLAGKPYQAMGKELFEERQHAKEHLSLYNQLDPNKIKQRNQILKKMFGKTGSSLFIEPPFRCDYGYNIFVGENFYANFNLTILDGNSVEIGDNVMIGPNVSIFTSGHPIHFEKRIKGWEYCRPISIENNVWIGGGAIINPGVSIGENSVIGAGSVVTKNIPKNVVAAGNPCKVIRQITDDDKNYFFKRELF